MKIPIGQTAEGKHVGFDLDLLITTRLLIQANSGAGKSYLLRKLMEQLFSHIQVICIDPEGEFATLREKYGFVLVGKGGETPADPRIAADVAEKLLELRASAVCDLYEMKSADRHAWVKRFLEAMINAPKKLWHPVVVVVDEAHVFAPEKGAGDSEAKESMIDLVTRGRKRGFCAVWATQRLAKVDKDATSSLLNRLVGGTFEDVDIKRALDLLSVLPEDKREMTQQLRTMEPGWFYAFGRAVSSDRLLFKVGEVQTSHPKPGSSKHAAEPPPAPEQIAKLLPSLADLPKAAEEKARTMQEMQTQIRSLKGELAAAKRVQPTEIDKRAFKQQLEAVVSKALEERDKDWMRATQAYMRKLESALSDGARKLDAAIHVLKFAPPEPLKVKARVSVENVLPARKEGTPTATKEAYEHTSQQQAAPPVAASLNGLDELGAKASLPPSQMKILGALAQFEAIGRGQVPKKWIAALAGVSHKSSGYTNNLGALRSRGLIDYPASGSAALTDAGRESAPRVDPPSNPDEMFARCLEIVTPAQAAILKALREAHPQAIAKDKLAERAGVSAASSGYTNNLGALRSAGMIDYPQQGLARLSDWTVLEG